MRIIYICVFVLLFSLTFNAQEQKCGSKITKSIKYKYLTNDDMGDGEQLLSIYVKKKHFNLEDMLLLARQFRNKFCKQDKIDMEIYDTDKIEESQHEPGNPIDIDPLLGLPPVGYFGTSPMGYYKLNRKTGKEILKFFIEKANEELEKIIVVFDKEKICITKEL